MLDRILSRMLKTRTLLVLGLEDVGAPLLPPPTADGPVTEAAPAEQPPLPAAATVEAAANK